MIKKYNQVYCQEKNISYFTVLKVYNIITNIMINNTRKISEINKTIDTEKGFLNQRELSYKAIENINNTISVIEEIKKNISFEE